MIIDFEQQTPSTRYHLLTQTIIPRPIAWVLSENEDSSLNLAPFSFFNAVCSEPALLALSIGKKPDGEGKDTRKNLLSGRDFVIHIPSVAHTEAVTASAATLAHGESEVAASGLDVVEFDGCAIGRLRDCAVAYQCGFYDVHYLGPNKQAVLYVEVKQLYVSDDVARVDGDGDKARMVVDAQALDPLGRLGAAQYAGLTAPFSVQRPK